MTMKKRFLWLAAILTICGAARNGASVVCEIPADKQGAYNLYRFECSGNPIDYSLAEITLNYE